MLHSIALYFHKTPMFSIVSMFLRMMIIFIVTSVHSLQSFFLTVLHLTLHLSEHGMEAYGKKCPDQFINNLTPMEFDELVVMFNRYDVSLKAKHIRLY